MINSETDSGSASKPELRDELAIQRTYLANERTLLAYLRAGISLILAGVTFIHFSQEIWYKLIGVLCIPVGITVLCIGTVRYRRSSRRIKSGCADCRM